MICPNCKSVLGHVNGAGEPMLRNRGVVFKAEGLAVVCPKCKGDVGLSAEFAKALGDRIVLFFKRATPTSPT